MCDECDQKVGAAMQLAISDAVERMIMKNINAKKKMRCMQGTPFCVALGPAVSVLSLQSAPKLPICDTVAPEMMQQWDSARVERQRLRNLTEG